MKKKRDPGPGPSCSLCHARPHPLPPSPGWTSWKPLTLVFGVEILGQLCLTLVLSLIAAINYPSPVAGELWEAESDLRQS